MSLFSLVWSKRRSRLVLSGACCGPNKVVLILGDRCDSGNCYRQKGPMSWDVRRVAKKINCRGRRKLISWELAIFILVIFCWAHIYKICHRFGMLQWDCHENICLVKGFSHWLLSSETEGGFEGFQFQSKEWKFWGFLWLIQSEPLFNGKAPGYLCPLSNRKVSDWRPFRHESFSQKIVSMWKQSWLQLKHCLVRNPSVSVDANVKIP